ncbi:MAG: protein disulfide oxidoreductase [Myxococcales bacterium]|nr:protein disulfide oxidoreductase [Myxococcales bacterium]MDD9971367.1 protein disulfide oxidoreductase [Myxococcales bacterium]
MSRLKRLPVWVRDALIFVVLLAGVRAYQQRGLPTGPSPALSGQTVTGQAVRLSDYRGAPVLVHFWATWCGVCRAEEGHVSELSQELPVITIASRSGQPQAIRAYLAERGLEFDAIADPTGKLAARFGVRAFPTTFVLSSTGAIRHVEVGYTTELGMRARMWLAGL